MLTNYSTIPIKLGILLVGFGLLVAGCDSSGPNAEEEQNEITFETADGLSNRITNVDGNSSSNVATNASPKAPTFTLKSHVLPPDLSGVSGDEAASHLALSKNGPTSNPDPLLYVGYKVRGTEYGGGIDILAAKSPLSEAPTASNGGQAPNALVVSNVDVQELAVKHETSGHPNAKPTALYAATAVEPDGGFSEAPQFHSIDLELEDGLPTSNVTNDSEELFSSSSTTRVAKSVVVAENNSNYDAFVASDANTVHAVDVGNNFWGINSVDKQEASSGTQFRSVTETSTGTAYALSDGGNLYSFGQLGLTTVTSSALSSVSSDFSIARLSSQTINGDDLLFVSLNDGGFRVFNTSTNEIVYSDTEIYATAVTATDNYVYVANGDGFGLYKVENSGLANTTLDEGLEDIGRASLNDLDGIGNVPGPTNITQVNDIVVDPNGNNNPIIYVAKSTDGVYRIEQTSGGGVWD